MKNKGFTLIELLAVIVILAIIALIATPIILGIINDAKEESDERSVELYASAIKNALANHQLLGNNPISGTGYTSDSLEAVLDVDYDGDVDCSVINITEDGKVTMSGCTVNGGTKEYSYGKEEGTQQFKTYKNGDIVYYDVDNGVGCEGSYTATQSNTGVKTGCMKFYAFNDDGGDKLNLILDHNTTAMVVWTNQNTYKNTNGPIDVIAQLKADTNNWKGTITPSNYTMDQSTTSSGANYTVDYSDYKARLITANEIAQITGKTGWDETKAASEDYYYFHDLSQDYKTGGGSVCASTGCTYGWLYDRTDTSCTDYGCFNNSDSKTSGYWTISSGTSYSYNAWLVYLDGNISCSEEVAEESRGVRPVITILKSQI